MKHIHFQLSNNLSLLHDELLQSVLSVETIVGPDGERHAVMMVEGDDSNVWLSVPYNAAEVAIRAVVQAHDPNSPHTDPTAQRLARIEELLAIGWSNWTAAQRSQLLELVARIS